jgi:CYTH domain-containing protein
MDKTARTELYRTYLIEQLPEPLTRASEHIQFFDNYIANTRMRLRSVRNPKTKEWTYLLQQRTFDGPSRVTISEIVLNEQEYERCKIFEGTEIRKNRHYHEFGGRTFEFDVYMGKLWGLNIARVAFEDEESLGAFEAPDFAFSDVTDQEFYLGENLVHRTFEDVQAEVAKSAAAAS